MHILNNKDLQAFNTLAVPAQARYFCQPSTLTELRTALQEAAKLQCPIFLLGDGSNVVLASDINAMVIHLKIKGREVLQTDNNYIWLRIGAAENWHKTVLFTLENHYFGLENLSLIPGSVGAAPIQNIGAYGTELRDVFDSLEAVHLKSGELRQFSMDECEFGYRDSVFKQRLRNQFVIVSLTLKLYRAPKLNLRYPALQQALETIQPENLTPAKVSDIVCDIRQSKLPDPKQIPNVGSFFKNPIVDMVEYQRLKQQEPELIAFDIGEQQKKIAAGWLIEQLGWRGKYINGIGMHGNQALVLTNTGRNSGESILSFAYKIQESVQQRFGISLDIEPTVVPKS